MRATVLRKFALLALTAITLALVIDCSPVSDPPDPPTDPFEQLYWNTLSTDWYDRNPSASEYIIFTANELAGLAKLVNTGKDFSGKTITLANNINLGGRAWVSIGYEEGIYYVERSYAFNGVFDGNGKTISGLYINYISTNENDLYTTGLFGFLDHGTVKNLGVVDVDITGDVAGGIVGSVGMGNVFNCYSSGTVIGVKGSVGGVVGGNNGNVVDCHFSGIVKGNYNVGGVVGKIVGGNVTACYANGTVNGGDYVGGVVGDIYDGNVTNSYSTSTVNGDTHLGGVVGRALEGSITNCYSTSAVSGINRIGGVVGVVGVGSTVANCYSTGIVSSSGDYNYNLNGVGGVVGSVFTRSEAMMLGITYGYDNNNVTNCAALNSIIKYDDLLGGSFDPTTRYVYRVAGGTIINIINDITLSNNIAFDGMVKESDDELWWLYDDGFGSGNANNVNGADITAAAIRADGTIGGRFAPANGWTVENGKLPGLLGQTVELPEHLR